MIRRWTPRRFVVLRRARIIASALSIALICTAFFAFSTRKAVALTVNGKSKIVTTYAMSAQRLLEEQNIKIKTCLLYTSPSPRDLSTSRMPSSA